MESEMTADGRPVPMRDGPAYRRLYLSVPGKFTLALAFSILWFAFSLWVALPWMGALAELAGWAVAIIVVGGVALIPGFMNAFLASSLLLDKRPPREPTQRHPSVSILVAAYNEKDDIVRTLESVERQDYAGVFEVIVIDDGSTDATAAVVESDPRPWLRLLRQPRNMGKAAALNRGLAEARHDLIVTIDADSYLYGDALRHIVERYCTDPEGTVAVAGSMLVGNSRDNWVTQAQEWDYFHGIAAVKRVQSMYHGTLVAQGAFSLYERAAIGEVGGWTDVVGEDIVLTWALLEKGYRIGHAEDALCFTQAPSNLKQFIRQRRRWARGMLEAFRRHPGILRVVRLSLFFIVWNLLYPWVDVTFTLVFIPGLVLALFGIYWIVGPMTLAVLPLAFLMNLLMFRKGRRMFDSQNLRVRRNVGGFLIYVLAYSMLLQPVSVAGYLSEIFGLRKTWGHDVRRTAGVLLLLLAPAVAAAQTTAGLGEVLGTSDSEGFTSIRGRTGALFGYESPLRFAGAAVQWTHYRHDEWSEDAPGVVFFYRDERPADLAGPRIEAGVVRVGDHARVTADASWTFRFGEATGLQLIAAADPVETAPAIDAGIVYGLGALALEQRIGERLTLVGLGGYQGFSDGNARTLARARVIWSVLPNEGLHAQVRWRGFDREELDVSGAYFNPDRYSEWDVGLYMRRWHRGWRYYGMGAIGRESITGVDPRTSGTLELRAEGPIRDDVHVAVHAAYTRSAGFALAEDYGSARGGVTLIVPLGGD